MLLGVSPKGSRRLLRKRLLLKGGNALVAVGMPRFGLEKRLPPRRCVLRPRQYKDIPYVKKLQPLKLAVMPIFQFDKAYFDC
jgi:hypothetical protein